MDDKIRQDYLRSLPSVDLVLQEKVLTGMQGGYPRQVIHDAVRETVNYLRTLVMQAESQEELSELETGAGAVAHRAAHRVRESLKPRLRPVINATGIILHTNLGRSLLASQALEAVREISRQYSNLELNLESGERGSRYTHVEDLLCRLTGAQGAMVVNNNAAAVMLVLNTLARGREVVISRGQLVEIGGSFRIPEVMAQSGATLVEVGTSNKTHLFDYQEALNDNTALLLKVHTSNYRIVGFTSQVSGAEMAVLGKKQGIPVVEDLGSGVLVDLSRYGLEGEPTVQDCLKEGMDLVTFSGDKLLGGPQAGIIVGGKEYIEKIKSNQLTRALRIDKMTLAALEATLQLYLEEEKAVREIPTLRMLTLPLGELQERAEKMAAFLREHLRGKARIKVVEGHSQVGGGALPLEEIPTRLVAFQLFGVSVEAFAGKLRREEVPVVARIHKNQLYIDLRTVEQGEEDLLACTLVRVLKKM